MDRLRDVEQRFGEELRLFCRRMVHSEPTAADVVQDVLAAACKTPIAEITHLRGWLYRVARNRCLDLLRRMKPQERLSAFRSSRGGCGGGGGQCLVIDPATTPAARAVNAERADRVMEALESIDDDLRSLVIMRYWHGFTRQQLAEILGLSRSGLDYRLVRAIGLLRDRLAALDESGA